MTVGLVVGKFAPLHRGHQLVIESARHQSDHVIVAVYDSPQFEPRVSIRAGWIGSLYPDVETLVLPDSCPKGSATKVTAVYAKQWLALRREIATVFSSESYGERFAHEIGASHTAVDPRRRLVPVSGSSIRADPYAHRRFLEPIVYRDLVRKVCLVGAESPGKTSLAAALARHFSTCWAPEYGRELYERKRGVLDFDDLLEIAREHFRREERLRLNSRRYLFCDTNALARSSGRDFTSAESIRSWSAWRSTYRTTTTTSCAPPTFPKNRTDGGRRVGAPNGCDTKQRYVRASSDGVLLTSMPAEPLPCGSPLSRSC